MISSDALNRRLARRPHAHDEQWWKHGLRSPRDLSILAEVRMLPAEPTYADFFTASNGYPSVSTELS